MEWKPVPKHPYIEVSDQGDVRDTATKAARNTYPASGAAPNGSRYRLTGIKGGSVIGVHRLVLEAFVGPCPGPRYEYEGSHQNGVRDDNSLGNLAWETRKRNAERRARDHQTQARGETCGKSKLTEAAVLDIRQRWARGTRQIDLAAEYGIRQSNVSAIVKRQTWKHI